MCHVAMRTFGLINEHRHMTNERIDFNWLWKKGRSWPRVMIVKQEIVGDLFFFTFRSFVYSLMYSLIGLAPCHQCRKKWVATTSNLSRTLILSNFLDFIRPFPLWFSIIFSLSLLGAFHGRHCSSSFSLLVTVSQLQATCLSSSCRCKLDFSRHRAYSNGSLEAFLSDIECIV